MNGADGGVGSEAEGWDLDGRTGSRSAGTWESAGRCKSGISGLA